MKIKEGFVLREVAGQAMVIAIGEASKEFHGLVKLNDTGKTIWQGILQGLSEEQIVDTLVENYEVDRTLAQADTRQILQQLQEAGFLIP